MKTELDLQKDFIKNPEIKDQLEFLKKGGAIGMDSFILADAFLKGIRDLGYKDSAYALNEINDNSIQAGARNIHYEFVGTSNKIDELVIYDDGHGMVPDMLSVAVNWGGTHRQNSRKGFGKYGYGLPSASLSLAKKYTVYSKTKGEDWHSIVFDITKLYSDKKVDVKEIKSEVTKCKLPKFIAEFEGKNYKVNKLESGTIIHYEELDRIHPKQISALKTYLMHDFGQTYFKLLNTTKMYVDGTEVKPVDILFATPGMLGYEDEMNDQKVKIDDKDHYDEKVVTIKDNQGEKHELLIRWSRLPNLFFTRNDSDIKKTEDAFLKAKIARSADTKSFRWKVAKDNHGITFRRLGRRMDCVRAFRGRFNIQNNSRYWKCEVNFPPVLDEHFAVNTSKQQIIPNDRLLDTLEEAGIFSYLKKIEKEYYDQNKQYEALEKEAEKGDQSIKKQSEIDAEEAAIAHGQQTATPEFVERKEKADKRKKAKIEEIAVKKNITVEQAAKDYEEVYSNRPTKFSEESLGKHSAILKFDEHGDTVEVIINMDHDFYKSFYMGPGSNYNSRKSWETFFLMFAQLFWKHTEDHQDFLNSFFNDLSVHLKTVSKKRYKNREDDSDQVNELDDDLPMGDDQQSSKIN